MRSSDGLMAESSGSVPSVGKPKRSGPLTSLPVEIQLRALRERVDRAERRVRHFQAIASELMRRLNEMDRMEVDRENAR